MDINGIKSHLQSFFSKPIVTIVGSGLSCAEGIPGMGELGKQLLTKVPGNIPKESMDIWNKIEKDLKDGKGLEEVLLKHKPDEEIEKNIKYITESFMRKAEAQVITSSLKSKKKLRFSEYIKELNISEEGTVIITTNYDRLLEFACEGEGILVDNLFTGNYLGKINEDSKLSFISGVQKTGTSKNKKRIVYKKHVIIYKPHGCLGWYRKSEEEVLYSCFNLGLENLIITPGGNKYRKGYDFPFDYCREKANDAIDTAECFVIIGYGFNDEHLQTHLLRKIKEGIPTLIISRDINEKVKELIKSSNSTAVYYYKNDYEEGTVVNIKGECISLKNYILWDLGEFVKGVLRNE